MTESNLNKHLNYFKVEGFKNFNSIELDDIGIFNIIIGDNNVGKTNLLESLIFDEDNYTSHLHNLGSLCAFRYKDSLAMGIKHDYIKSFFNFNLDTDTIKYNFRYNPSQSKIDFLSIQKVAKENLTLEDRDEIQKSNITPITNVSLENCLKFTSNKGSRIVSSAYSEHLDFEINPNYIPFIASNLSHGGDLTGFYSQIISNDKSSKKQLIDYLRIFFKNIDSIELGNSNIKDELEILIGLENINILQPLSMFGDGFVKYFRILLEVFIMKNKRLMIDELDNGIHYKRQKDFIKNIILAAIKNNTQIFCTTHSIECLRSINEAFNDPELKDQISSFRAYSLNKTKDDVIKAYKYNFDEFSSTLDSDADIRGGF